MKKVDIILTLATLAYADNCGGNCPLNDCPMDTCSCGHSSNAIDIAYWCSQFPGWSQSCCKCIASNISNGNTNAETYNSNGFREIGVWQINSTNWDFCNYGTPPCSATSNLNCENSFGLGVEIVESIGLHAQPVGAVIHLMKKKN